MGSLAETSTGEAQLYERHSELVYRYCLRMLRSREDAEDASQTTFVQALKALRRGMVPAFEQAWLLTIARNECRSRHRASKRRKELELARDPHVLEEVAGARESGGEMLIGVEAALARMPEMQRRALLLREWRGHSYAEIAQELSLSPGAVETLLYRARKSFAKQLGAEQKTRKHALDLASLLGSLKSLLGGGAAVKAAAVGAAAVASLSVAVGRSHDAPPPAKEPEAAGAVAPAESSAVPQSERVRRIAGPSAVASRRNARATARTRPALNRAATPAARGAAATAAPPTPAPSAAPAAEPTAPAAPRVPELPNVEAPPKPPALPVQVPEIPQAAELPQAPPLLPPPPSLPQVPNVQAPDVAGLPKLP